MAKSAHQQHRGLSMFNGGLMRRVERKLDAIANDTSEVKNDVARITERLSHAQDRQHNTEIEAKEINHEVDNISTRLTSAENEIKELRRYSAAHKKQLTKQEDDTSKAKPFICGLKWLTERAAIAVLAIVATVLTQGLNFNQEIKPTTTVMVTTNDNQRQHVA